LDGRPERVEQGPDIGGSVLRPTSLGLALDCATLLADGHSPESLVGEVQLGLVDSRLKRRRLLQLRLDVEERGKFRLAPPKRLLLRLLYHLPSLRLGFVPGSGFPFYLHTAAGSPASRRIECRGPPGPAKLHRHPGKSGATERLVVELRSYIGHLLGLPERLPELLLSGRLLDSLPCLGRRTINAPHSSLQPKPVQLREGLFFWRSHLALLYDVRREYAPVQQAQQLGRCERDLGREPVPAIRGGGVVRTASRSRD
jgi:hypothetical protein